MIPGVLGAVAAQNRNSDINYIWRNGQYSARLFYGQFLGDCSQRYTDAQMESANAKLYDMKDMGLQSPSLNYLRMFSQNNKTYYKDEDNTRYAFGYIVSPVRIDVSKYSKVVVTVKNNGTRYVRIGGYPGTSSQGFRMLATPPNLQDDFRLDNGALLYRPGEETTLMTIDAGETKTITNYRIASATSGIYYPTIRVDLDGTSTIRTFDVHVLDWHFEK